MKHLFRTALAIGIVSLIMASPASATLRCGGKIIDAKSTREEVLTHCGEPTNRKESLQEVKMRNCASLREYNDFDNEHEYYAEKASDPCIRIISIEEWFYNFGPTQYTYTFRFENAELADIKRGEHGK